LPLQARGVEGVAGNQQLHLFADGEIGANHLPRAGPVLVQQQDLEGIAEIVVVELVIADAVEPHRRARRDQKVERRAHRPSVGERRRQAAGRDRLRAQVGRSHETAGRFGSSCSNAMIRSAVSSSAMPRSFPPRPRSGSSLVRSPRAQRETGRPQPSAAGDLALEPDQVAIDAEERRGAVGQHDPLHLDHAIAAMEAPSHRSSL
jgi:hypothetical protein